tara:strand:+ start:31 stop:879 length:849 start_codon:yes stop_codon:yes gene_type:complete
MSVVIDRKKKPPVAVRQDALASLRSSELERDDSGDFRIYRDKEGKSYYSVTTILSNTEPEAKRRALEKWKSKPGSAEDLEIACNRGTITHEHCEYVLKVASKININICNAKNNWRIYDDGLARGPKAITKKCIQTAKSRQNKVHWTARKYATVLADWIEENVSAIHASEFSIHHPIGFAGQSDALIDYKKNGNLCILDFKTSGSNKPKPDAWLDGYRLQLSSYAWALEQQTGIKPAMGLIVIARENGYQVVELNTLELAGGRILFEERLNQFKDMLSTGSCS